MGTNVPPTSPARSIDGHGLVVQTSLTLNVPGTYVQFIAATTGPARYIGLYFYRDAADVTAMTVDVAVGPGGSEVVKLTFRAPVSAVGFLSLPIDASLIPAGSRVACRATNTTDNTSRGINLGCYFGVT